MIINKIKEIASNIFEDIVKIRRNIHKNPELSFEEYQTSSYIKSILDNWGIPFTDGLADTGILVLLEGKKSTIENSCITCRF